MQSGSKKQARRVRPAAVCHAPAAQPPSPPPPPWPPWLLPRRHCEWVHQRGLSRHAACRQTSDASSGRRSGALHCRRRQLPALAQPPPLLRAPWRRWRGAAGAAAAAGVGWWRQARVQAPGGALPAVPHARAWRRGRPPPLLQPAARQSPPPRPLLHQQRAVLPAEPRPPAAAAPSAGSVQPVRARGGRHACLVSCLCAC